MEGTLLRTGRLKDQRMIDPLGSQGPDPSGPGSAGDGGGDSTSIGSGTHHVLMFS